MPNDEKKDEDVRNSIFGSLKAALVHAKFSEPVIRTLVDKLIFKMESDLDECYWSPNSRSESSASELQNLINQLDKDEDIPEVVEDVKPPIIDEEPEKLEIAEVEELKLPEIELE
jgi:hypothetical protein